MNYYSCDWVDNAYLVDKWYIFLKPFPKCGALQAPGMASIGRYK